MELLCVILLVVAVIKLENIEQRQKRYWDQLDQKLSYYYDKLREEFIQAGGWSD